MRGGRAPARDVLRRTRLGEGPTQAERLRSRERRANSTEGAPPAAPGTLAAERRGSRPAGSASPPPGPDSPAQSQATVGWDGRPPYLGKLDLQAADGARQGRRLPVRLPVLHGPVGGGHGSSALPGPRRPSLRRWLWPGWCAACSRGDSSAPLYGATHASRPRGPSNWLQDRRKGGRAGGEGAGPPHPTPPAAPAGARPPPARPPRRARSPAPEAALGGAPPKSHRAPEVPELPQRARVGSGGARATAPGPFPESGELSPPHLPPPARRRSAHSADFGRRAALRECAPPPPPASGPEPRPGSGRPTGRPRFAAHVPGPGVRSPGPRSQDRRPPRPTRPLAGTASWALLAQMARTFPAALGLHTPRARRQENRLALPLASWASVLNRRGPPCSRGPGLFGCINYTSI